MTKTELGDAARALRDKVKANPLPLSPAGTHTAETMCQPDCYICAGLGWYRKDLPRDHPEFGKLFQCPNINVSKAMGDKSGLTEAERLWDWKKVWDVGDAKKAQDAVVEVLKQGHGWVYIWGGYGVAKTLLLKVAVARWMKRGAKGAYVRMASIIDNLREAYELENVSAEARLNFWSDIPLLCIDEFDRMRETPYAEERRFVLMDKRYEEATRMQSITIMASNVNPDGLGSGYLADRIEDGRFKVVYVGGASVRPQMLWESE